MKNIIWLLLLTYVIDISNAQTPQTIKPRPVFSSNTFLAANRILIPRNVSLTTVILVAEATTYKEAQPILYSILENIEFFTIDSYTGYVTVNSPFIDQTRNSYQFTIVATDSAKDADQQSSFLNVNVELMDVNNNMPKFSVLNPYYVAVSELVEANSIIYNQLSVFDMDWSQNNVLNIYCDSSSSYNTDANLSCQQFSIECNLVGEKSYKCNIRLMKPLNFYLKPNYIITITAKNNVIGKTTSINFVIDVINSRASSPYFSESSYILYLDQYTSIGSNVLELSVENEINPLADKSFYLKDPQNYFALNTSTFSCVSTSCSQSIQLIKQFNYATEYTFEATYISLNGAITSKIYVIIAQQKTARKEPIFLNQPYQIIVPENLRPGSIVQNTNIIVAEPEYLSFYSSGFTLQLLNTDFFTPSSTFELAYTFAKTKATVILRLKSTAQLDFENGPRRYDLILKVTTNSLTNYANLTIGIGNSNDCVPKFQISDTAILNNPEVLKVNDIIANVAVTDCDNTQNSVMNYALIGSYRDRFWIDAIGRIYLLQPLLTNFDEVSYFNLTLVVSDEGGYSDFTSFVIYVNTTLNSILQQSIFSLSVDGPKSELNLNDFTTLVPPLTLVVNSVYKLKYYIISTTPNITNVQIDQDTGQIYLISPFDDKILSNYDRIIIGVQVIQYQEVNSYTLFLGSLTCSAIIFFKSNAVTIQSKPPYFLRNFYTIVDREYVYQNVPLITITAISANGNNRLLIAYYILNDTNLFSIDRTQGFIYPLRNLSLPINIYTLTVLAIDPGDNSTSITTVRIQIVARSDNTIVCDTKYLAINVSPNSFAWDSSYVNLGALSCVSSSLFSDPDFQYSIGTPIGVYDCNGYGVNYLPYIGIASKNGSLFSFEKLTRDKFCDAFYIINVFKDQTAVSIPFHLILTTDSNYGTPVFLNNTSSTIYIPNFAYNGAFLANIFAYDRNLKQLVKSYTIAKTQNSNYFNIDSLTGILTLKQAFDSNNLPPSSTIPLSVIAASPNGLTSTLNLQIDFSALIRNFLKIQFDSNLNNSISLIGNQVYTNPIYSATATCSNTLVSNNGLVPCGGVEYQLNFFRNSNFSNFAIDNSQNVYLTSPLVYDVQIQTKYVFILNANLNTNPLQRLNLNAFKDVSVIVEANRTYAPRFEYSSYSVSLLDTTPVGTLVLIIRYLANPDDLITFKIEQISNIQINNYFELRNSQAFQTISVVVKSSPIINDKPELSFLISIKSANSLYANVVSTTTVNINLLTSFTLTNYPKFQQPFMPNEQIYINIDNYTNNSVIYQLKATNTNSQSLILYRIVNQAKSSNFYIDGNNIRISLPFSCNERRNNFLLFIEARDTVYPSSFSYTTLNVIIINNTITDARPYFDPYLTNGNLYLNIYDNFPINTQIYDVSSLIKNSDPSLNIYVFDAVPPYNLNTQFMVNLKTKSLILTQTLNYLVQSQYRIFIYITNKVYSQNTYNPASTDINNILFVYIQIASSNKYPPYFIDYTRFIFVEPSSSIKTSIGYARAVDNDISQPNNVVKYGFVSCNYRSYNNEDTKDKTLCDLFYIADDGSIYTNNQQSFNSYKNGYFTLIIYAMDKGYPSLNSTVQILVYFTIETEKARLVINIPSDRYFIDFLKSLQNDINQAINVVYDYGLLDYYFSYIDYSIPYISDSFIQLDVNFHILKVKAYQLLTYKEAYDLLMNNAKVKNLFQYYSVTKLERSYSRDSYTWWRFSPLSVGVMILACFTLFITLLAIIVLILCWVSHMKHALVTRNLETTDCSSNNILIG